MLSVCHTGGSWQIFVPFLAEWSHHPLVGSSQPRKCFSACSPQTAPSLHWAGAREWLCPKSSHLYHLRSQLFSDCELSACNPSKQVWPTPASSLLCMRNLIVFDRLLTMEKKTWIGLNALCLDLISQRSCCIINWRISCNLTLRQKETQLPEAQPYLHIGWLGVRAYA